MIHAAAPHFLWLFAVRYAAHQLNLWSRVSLPKTSPALHWTGKVGDVWVFRVWGSRAFVHDTSADKLSARAIPCVFLGFVPDALGWQFYHPTSRRVLPSQNVTFDESVPFYRSYSLGNVSGRPSPWYYACSGSCRPRWCSRCCVEGAASGGAEPRGAGSEGAGSGGAEPEGVEPGGAESEGAEPEGTESEGAESGGAEPRGATLSGGPAACKPGDAGAGGAAVTTGAGDTTEPGAAGARGAGGAGAGGVDPGAGGTVRTGPFFVPLLLQVLCVPSSTGLPPPFLFPLPDQSQPPLQPTSPLPIPSPYTEQSEKPYRAS
ncbi:unnamed protein product [Closterium sp. NIES-54]